MSVMVISAAAQAVISSSMPVKTAVAEALLSSFDAASGPCQLKFYTGTRPADPDTAVTTQTLLGTLTCSDPAGSVTDDTLTLDTIFQDSAADATGTATWARLVDGAGAAQADFDVSDTAGSASIKMNTTSIVVGGPIQVSSFTIVIGA